MDIEPICELDLKSIEQLQPEGWANIMPKIEYYLEASFCIPVKMMHQGKIVGIGAGIILGKTGWLAHIIVSPDHRNKGIGSDIVAHLIKVLQHQGCESISLIATTLGYPLYKKLGFREQTDYVFMQREETFQNMVISDKIHSIDKLYDEGEDKDKCIQEIIALDLFVSGEERFRVLLQVIDEGFVYVDDHRVKGFYIPSLGEGLVVACDSTSGIELMKLRYSRTNKGTLPINNSEGIEFLTNRGFIEMSRAKRMIYGKDFDIQLNCVYNRIAGNLG